MWIGILEMHLEKRKKCPTIDADGEDLAIEEDLIKECNEFSVNRLSQGNGN